MLLEKSQAAPRARSAVARSPRSVASTRASSRIRTRPSSRSRQALCELPTSDEYAAEVERLCGQKQASWAETLETVTETIKGAQLGATEQAALLVRAARWYDTRSAARTWRSPPISRCSAAIPRTRPLPRA